MKKTSVVILVIVFSAVAFYGGMFYSENTYTPPASSSSGSLRGFRGGSQQGGGAGGGFISGTIISKDSTSINLQLPSNAGSQFVFYSPSTRFMKTVNATIADFTAGENIRVVGTANSDGSFTATSIQNQPQFAAQTQQSQQAK